MNRLLLAALSGVLCTLSLGALAQQGPAGVPGAVFLFADEPPARPARRPAIDCRNKNNPEECAARQEAHKKALAACKRTTGSTRKQCLKGKPSLPDCSKDKDPALCKRMQQAHVQCKDKPASEHLQCLRAILAPGS